MVGIAKDISDMVDGEIAYMYPTHLRQDERGYWVADKQRVFNISRGSVCTKVERWGDVIKIYGHTMPEDYDLPNGARGWGAEMPAIIVNRDGEYPPYYRQPEGE